MLLIGNVGFAKTVEGLSIAANIKEWGTELKIKIFSRQQSLLHLVDIKLFF